MPGAGMTGRHPVADLADAATLRHAAWVVEQRSRRKTFAIQVIIRVLERMADRLDGGQDVRH